MLINGRDFDEVVVFSVDIKSHIHVIKCQGRTWRMFRGQNEPTDTLLKYLDMVPSHPGVYVANTYFGVARVQFYLLTRIL